METLATSISQRKTLRRVSKLPAEQDFNTEETATDYDADEITDFAYKLSIYKDVCFQLEGINGIHLPGDERRRLEAEEKKLRIDLAMAYGDLSEQLSSILGSSTTVRDSSGRASGLFDTAIATQSRLLKHQLLPLAEMKAYEAAGAARRASKRMAKLSLILILKDKPFTAHREIQKLLTSATSEVAIADNFVNEVTLDLIRGLPGQLKIRLLTKQMKGQFKMLPPKLIAETGHRAEVRLTNDLHDRWIFVDSECYISGTSLKQLGGERPSVLVRLEGKKQTEAMRVIFDHTWQDAKAVN
jgi:hypothetical protein